MELLEKYVNEFNQNDEEIYSGLFNNSESLTFLKKEIPIFECPDKDIEKAYYFRWWTFRKHIKKIESGYVITEFLPHVCWSDPETNVINAPVGHHINEGRWLKNSKRYLLDYIDFILDNDKIGHQYSTWMLYALMEYDKREKLDIDNDFLMKLDRYYKIWEDEHLLKNGMFWSYDNADAMEFSISGNINGKAIKGCRPTLNSYMCADSRAMVYFAKRVHNTELEERYQKKYDTLCARINSSLWQDGFYRAFHFEREEQIGRLFENKQNIPMELIGYIPWMFNIPPKERDTVFDLLVDRNVFLTDIGITTADQREDKFLYEADHECLWNGYVWPFATSQTLMALYNVIKRNDDKKYQDMYFYLLKQYAKSHIIAKEDGKSYPWIDEVLHPFTGEWSARAVLKKTNWVTPYGTYRERGKDYNHSTFCDLVLTVLTGIAFENNSVSFAPIIPDDWDYYKIENLSARNRTYTVIYDKTGEKYGKGKGLTITENVEE